MPTITIDRSTSRLPSNTGLGPSSTIQLDQTSILGEVGKVMGEFQAKAQEAEDATYLATAGVEATKRREAIRAELRQKYAANPKGYSEELYTRLTEEVYNPIAEAAPSSNARQATKLYMAEFAQKDVLVDTAWEKEATVVNFKASTDEAINVLANSVRENPNSIPEAAAQMELLLKSAETYLDPLEVNKYRTEKQKELAKSSIIGTMEKSTSAAKNLLNTGEFDGLFDADEMERFIDAIDRKEASNEAKALRAQAKADLELQNSIALGILKAEDPDAIQAEEDKLEMALAEGRIEIPKYSVLLEKITKKEEEMIGDIQTQQSIQNARQNGIPVDAKDKKIQKVLDKEFERDFLPALQGRPEAEQAEEIVTYVTETGYLPNPLKSDLTTLLAAKSPESAVKAADMVNALIDRKRSLADQFDTNTIGLASRIHEGHKAGLSPEQAVKAAEVQTYEKNTEQYKKKIETFNLVKKPFDVSKVFPDIKAGGTETPEDIKKLKDLNVTQVASEYDTLMRTFMVDEDMTEENASKAAYALVGERWGVSELNGKPKFMKYAPEKKYGVEGIDNDWIKEDLRDTVIDLLSNTDPNFPKDFKALEAQKEKDVANVLMFDTATMSKLDESSAKRLSAAKETIDRVLEQVIIKVDPRTEGSETPAYGLWRETPTGLAPISGYEIGPDGKVMMGEPAIWRPDFKESKYYKDYKAEEDRRAKVFPEERLTNIQKKKLFKERRKEREKRRREAIAGLKKTESGLANQVNLFSGNQ